MKSGAVQHLADGAAMTGAGFARAPSSPDTDESNATNRYLVARLAPGTDAGRVGRDIRALPRYVQAAQELPYLEMVTDAIGRPTLPPEVDRVRNVAWFGPMLAILMSVLALIAVAHALITATRRRRHDLAILKAMGFNRHQVRATLAWEATTLAVVGLVIGIPAGIIVGRFVWAVVAGDLGVATSAVLPGLAPLLLVPATLLIVNAVAYLPARAASRNAHAPSRSRPSSYSPRARLRRLPSCIACTRATGISWPSATSSSRQRLRRRACARPTGRVAEALAARCAP